MIRKIVNKFLRGQRSAARDENLMKLHFDLSNLFEGQERSCDSTAEVGSEDWIMAMAQRREEMKQFIRIGAIAASDERAELIRALKYARRAIDACAPYAETTEAMSAPEFREEINRLMLSIAGVLMRRPDADDTIWQVAQPYPMLEKKPSELG